MNPTAGRLLLVVAFVVFVLVIFGVKIFGLNELEEVSAGLAFFAAGHLVP